MSVNITPKLRPAVRILLVDESDRTFLFKGRDPKNKSDLYWCPVGGAMEPGETPEAAIRREVFEETGLANFELGPHIWNREVILSWNGALIHSKERCLLPTGLPNYWPHLLKVNFPKFRWN